VKYVDKDRGILVFYEVSDIVWNSNLGAFRARDLVFMILNRESCVTKFSMSFGGPIRGQSGTLWKFLRTLANMYGNHCC
jgi:hypothetical protein